MFYLVKRLVLNKINYLNMMKKFRNSKRTKRYIICLHKLAHKNKKIRINRKKIATNKRREKSGVMTYLCMFILVMMIPVLSFINNDDSSYYEDLYNVLEYYNDIETSLNSPKRPSYYIKPNKDVNFLTNNYPQVTSDSKPNESIILNKVKDLCLKKTIAEYEVNNNEVIKLKAEIYNNKLAYKSLIKDIDLIMKEFKP